MSIEKELRRIISEELAEMKKGIISAITAEIKAVVAKEQMREFDEERELGYLSELVSYGHSEGVNRRISKFGYFDWIVKTLDKFATQGFIVDVARDHNGYINRFSVSPVAIEYVKFMQDKKAARLGSEPQKEEDKK